MVKHDYSTALTIWHIAKAHLRRKRLAAAVAACTLAAVPAAAQQVSVYDKYGKLVGPLVGTDTVLITLNGFQQYLSIANQSLVVNAQFYFGGPGCIGNLLVAYDNYSELLPHAAYDGYVLYYLDPRQDANYVVQSKLQDGKCVSLPAGQTLVATSAHPAAWTFVPPFTVR